MNSSKKDDVRFKIRWRLAGAIGTVESAIENLWSRRKRNRIAQVMDIKIRQVEAKYFEARRACPHASPEMLALYDLLRKLKKNRCALTTAPAQILEQYKHAFKEFLV